LMVGGGVGNSSNWQIGDLPHYRQNENYWF
jgi:hypothetical protein